MIVDSIVVILGVSPEWVLISRIGLGCVFERVVDFEVTSIKAYTTLVNYLSKMKNLCHTYNAQQLCIPNIVLLQLFLLHF